MASGGLHAFGASMSMLPNLPSSLAASLPHLATSSSHAETARATEVVAMMRARRGAMHGRALEPLMCGNLLKRGKTLGAWKLRWYTLGVDGDLTCYHRRRDQEEAKPPMFTVQVGMS